MTIRFLLLALALSGGCASNDLTRSDGGAPDLATEASDDGGFFACATFSAEAHVAPAAMLFVLDRTASMSELGKWQAAQDAIVRAIDEDAFDGLSLGLLTFPKSAAVPGPACIQNFPIYCGISSTPQVALQPAGADKSSAASGVRHDIARYLTDTTPEAADLSDSSPIYAALDAGYQLVKAAPGVDKRVVVLITDGGGSCTSIASPPRTAYVDNNGCSDWEQPATMASLITSARTDAAAPTETFIIGVPGSNSNGAQAGSYDTPPYSMLLALSSYAVAGSPTTVDPACDQTLPFSKTGAAPAHPCHIDLSNNAGFNPDVLTTAITAIRGKALGCTYALPELPAGQLLDPNEVNVVMTVDGTKSTIPKRGSSSDACATTPCWDYDARGQVELIGAACASVTHSPTAKVEIYVGCTTIIL